mmetsp:Transcript_42341/g.75084  ORF Transcript_42341/g.75084 Transcript_42341/m.75084 type:complete len:83 (-) Transcript_42341:888-1136(-)
MRGGGSCEFRTGCPWMLVVLAINPLPACLAIVGQEGCPPVRVKERRATFQLPDLKVQGSPGHGGVATKGAPPQAPPTMTTTE